MTLTTEYQLVGSCWQGSAVGANYYQGIYAKYSRTSSQELNNKSTIYIKVCAWNDASSSAYSVTGGPWIGTLRGLFTNSWSANASVYGGTSEANRTILWASQIEVSHNDSGDYSTYIGAINVDAPIDNSVSTSIQDITLTLPSIPRSAELTISTNQLTIGDTLSTWNSPYVSNFTYTLTVNRGGTTLTIYEKKNYSDYTLNTLTAGFYHLFQPNETQCMATLQLITYNGNTAISSDAKTLFLYADPSHNPTVSINSIDTGKEVLNDKTTLDLTGNNKRIINDWNNITTTYSARSNTNLPIVGININGVSVPYDKEVNTTNYVDISSNFTITATDGYSRTTSLTESDLTFIPYDIPTIVPVVRRNTTTDGKVNLDFTGMFYNVDFGKETNELTLTWYVREKGAANYTQGATTLTYTINDDNTTYTSATTISLVNPLDTTYGLFDYTKAYDFQFVATDKVTSYTISNVIIPKGIPNFVVFKDTIMANGQKIDPIGLLDMVHPVGEVYTTTNANFNPNTVWGGTWEQLSADAYLKIVTSDGGKTGGTSSQHKIPIESMPSHTHTFNGNSSTTSTDGWHTHSTYNDNDGGGHDGMYIVGNVGINDRGYIGGSGSHSHTVTASGWNSNTGSDNAYYPYFYGVYAWHRTA